MEESWAAQPSSDLEMIPFCASHCTPPAPDEQPKDAQAVSILSPAIRLGSTASKGQV